MKSVLIIDDQRWNAKNLEKELKNEFVPYICTNILESANLLLNGFTVDCVVLDVMMPAPQGRYIDVTRGGHDTGIWFLDNMQDFFVGNRIPILIFTNRLLNYTIEKISAMPIPNDFYSIKHKQMTSNVDARGIVRTLCEKRSSLPSFPLSCALSAFNETHPEFIAALESKYKYLNQLSRRVHDLRSLIELLEENQIKSLGDRDCEVLFSYIDLMKVAGIGPRYAGMLMSAGVFSRDDLCRADHEDLFSSIQDFNRHSHYLEECFCPTRGQIKSWIDSVGK